MKLTDRVKIIVGKCVERLQASSLVKDSHVLRSHVLAPWFKAHSKLRDVYYKIRLLPNTIAIENTTACNRKCPYCPHYWEKRQSKYMPTEMIWKIFNDLSYFDYSGTVLFAPLSEPLLDTRLPLIVKYARDRLRTARIRVLTNGDLLTRAMFESLVSAGVDEFHVSDHFAINGNSYVMEDPKSAIETFHNLEETEKQRFTFLDNNYRRIKRLDKFHNRIGLLPLEGYQSVRDEWGTCNFPETCLAINYRGDVLLCCRQWVEGPTFGNVQTEHLGKIWRKKRYEAIRKDLRRGVFEENICKECGFGYMPAPAVLQAQLRPDPEKLIVGSYDQR